MIKLAIVILNWNGKEYLTRFLPSVLKNSPVYARVIVADNGSKDGSISMLENHFPEVWVIDLGKNYGYTGGYNRALEQIDAEFFVLLNSDMEVSPGWINPLMELMDGDDSVAACQPKIMSWHQRDEFEYAGASGGFIDYLGYPFCRGRIFEHLEKDTGQYEDVMEVFWATGACLFVRAKDFRDAGALDEEFFAHMEEIDLAWRFKRMGKKVYCCPKSIVYHVGGGTLPKNNPRKTYLNFRNNMFLLARNLPARTFYPVFLQRLLLDNLAATRFLLNGQYKDFVAVEKAIFSVVARLRAKRKQGKALPYRKVYPVYKKSIVRAYFLGGLKQFSSLKSKYFRSY